MSISRYHPIQKLCYIHESSGRDIVLAATGPYILSLDFRNGGLLSRWPEDVDQEVNHEGRDGSRNGNFVGNSVGNDPPTKRRKTSPFQEEDQQGSGESFESIEFVSERAKGQRRKKKQAVKSTLPNISHIISTVNGRYITAVTADDKCIRVFEIDSTGRLKPLSQRQAALCLPMFIVLTIPQMHAEETLHISTYQDREYLTCRGQVWGRLCTTSSPFIRTKSYAIP